MIAALLFLLAGMVTDETVRVIHVDVIEFNRFGVHPDGSGGGEQIIYWKEFPEGMRVISWRIGHKDSLSEDGLVDWRVGYDGVHVQVRGRRFVETKSQFDPEVDERSVLPGRRREILR